MELEKYGWMVSPTYNSGSKKGLDYPHFVRLLEEMQAQDMNFLSIMMVSYGLYDTLHDGFCWPIQNPRLRCYLDKTALNSHAETEFITRVLDDTARRGIKVGFFLNWGIWNHSKIIQNYPDSAVQRHRKKGAQGWLHCPDSPGAWDFGTDSVSDLLTFYRHKNLHSVSVERIGYTGGDFCYCPHTRAAFGAETGIDMDVASAEQIKLWKSRHIGQKLSDYKSHIRLFNPDLQLWLHTQGKSGWGHDPKTLQSYGVDALLPHTVQKKQTKRQLLAMVDRLAPNDCYLHFDLRDRAPVNYKIWKKTPRIIQKSLKAIHQSSRSHIKGLVFFNEAAVSPKNRRAAYRFVKNME